MRLCTVSRKTHILSPGDRICFYTRDHSLKITAADSRVIEIEESPGGKLEDKWVLSGVAESEIIPRSYDFMRLICAIAQRNFRKIEETERIIAFLIVE